jgi:hypothetical protein
MIRMAIALIDFELLFLPVTVETIEKTRNVETTSLRGKRAKATEVRKRRASAEYWRL